MIRTVVYIFLGYKGVGLGYISSLYFLVSCSYAFVQFFHQFRLLFFIFFLCGRVVL